MNNSTNTAHAGGLATIAPARSKTCRAIIIAATTMLMGCVSQPPAPEKVVTSPYHLSPSEMDVIKRDLASDLKDPASAMFGAIAAVRNEKGVVVACGTVNARNSFGGYTGKKPFWGVLGTNTAGERRFAATGIGETDTESSAIMILCQRHGLG